MLQIVPEPRENLNCTIKRNAASRKCFVHSSMRQPAFLYSVILICGRIAGSLSVKNVDHVDIITAFADDHRHTLNNRNHTK